MKHIVFLLTLIVFTHELLYAQSSALTANAGADKLVCLGVSTTLNGSVSGGRPPYTYSWSLNDGTILSTTSSLSVSSTTVNYIEYTLTVTDKDNNVATDKFFVAFYSANPTISASPQTICPGVSSNLQVDLNVLVAVPIGFQFPTQQTIYDWTPKNSGLSCYDCPNPVANPSATTTYTCTVTDPYNSSCTASPSVTVYVAQQPAIQVTPSSATICEGESIELTASRIFQSDASEGDVYTWSPTTGLSSATGATVTASPNSTTIYTVTLTDVNGCTASQSITVTVNPNPIVTATANPSAICPSGSSTLQASILSESTGNSKKSGITYTWSPSEGLNSTTGATVIATPSFTTDYSVEVNANGCINLASVTVYVNQPLQVFIYADPPEVCKGSSTTLTVLQQGDAGGSSLPEGSTVVWSSTEDLSSSTGESVTTTPRNTSIYTATVTSPEGCTGTASITVTVNEPPKIQATASPSTICAGESSTLTVAPLGNYDVTSSVLTIVPSWSPATGLSSTQGVSVTASPTTTTTYTVIVTDENGCTATASVTVNVKPSPSITAAADPSAICEGQSTTLSAAETGKSISNNNGNNDNPRGGNIQIAIDTKEPNTGNSISFTWSPSESLSSATGQTVTATPANTTTYTVTGTAANGCTGTAEVTVTVNPFPTVTLAPFADVSVTSPAFALTGGSPAGGTYSGQGVINNTFDPAATGEGTFDIIYTYTDATGCSGSDTEQITVIPPPPPSPCAFCWAVKAGGPNSIDDFDVADLGQAIATDAAGNSYVTGYFTNPAAFENTTLLPTGYRDMFVAKYNTAGQLQWVQQIGGLNGDRSEIAGRGITVSESGDVYVTGLFNGTAVDMRSFSMLTSNGTDVLIAKYSNSGDLQWMQQAGGASSDIGTGIAADGSGNIYVVGAFLGNAAFGYITLTDEGYGKNFIAKYNASGTIIWARAMGAVNVPCAVSVDNSNNAYVTGSFIEIGTFGSTQLTSSGFEDIFIAKYNPAGALQWVHQAGGSASDHGNGITVDAAGNAYITGDFQSGATGATFGASVLTAIANKDFFIAKYAANGDFQWVRQTIAGPGGIASGKGISINRHSSTLESVYAVGNIEIGVMDADPKLFVVRYSTSGDFICMSRSEVPSGAEGSRADGWGISMDMFGNVYITGGFGWELKFGNTTLYRSFQVWAIEPGTPLPFHYDIFVAKICDGIFIAPPDQPVAILSFNNYGVNVMVQPTAYINVDGNILNERGGSNAVKFNTNSGMFGGTLGGIFTNTKAVRLTKDWINNAGNFAFYNADGLVELYGEEQKIKGTSTTQFFNLTLSGYGTKSMYVDARVNGVLQLNHNELATRYFTMWVNTPNKYAILRSSGFVSSLDGGFLSRDMNAIQPYVFPVGSSMSPPRYRPVDITPSTIPATVPHNFKVRMVNNSPDEDGYDRTIKYQDVDAVNNKFYHLVSRGAGNDNAAVKFYYDNVLDDNFQCIGYWGNPPAGFVPLPANMPVPLWLRADNISFNLLPSPSFSDITTGAWQDFSSNVFALIKAGFVINTADFGDGNDDPGEEDASADNPGGTSGGGGGTGGDDGGVKFIVTGPGLSTNTGTTGGDNPPPYDTPNGKSDGSGGEVIVPDPADNPNNDPYTISVLPDDDHVGTDVTFNVDPDNGTIGNVEVNGNPLATDLYEIINGTTIVLNGVPQEGPDCKNDIKVKLNATDPLVLNTATDDVFEIQGLDSSDPSLDLKIYKQDGTLLVTRMGTSVINDKWDGGKMAGTVEAGLYRFELTVSLKTGGTYTGTHIFKGQFFVQ